MNDPSTAEWWRAQPAHMKDKVSHALYTPALKTGDGPVAYRALMAFMFVLLISPQTVFPVLAPLRLAMLATMIAISTHVLSRVKQGLPVFEFTREMTLVSMLVGWAVITVPFSSWPGGSVSFLMEFYIKTLVLFWLLANVINTLPRLQNMVWGLSLMSVPLALTGVKNYLAGVYMAGGGGRVDGYSAPLTSNPNDLALMLNLLLPMTIALFLGNPRPVIRMILAGIIVLNVIAIFATFSRAGFLTLAVIFMVYIWRLRKRPERRWAWMVLCVAILSAPFVPSNYINRINTIINIEADQTGSSQQRWSDTVFATKYVLKHPLTGAGIGMNILALDKERGSYGPAIHNVYLQYAVELGLPGLILFILLLKTSINSTGIARGQLLPGQDSAALYFLAEGIRTSLIAFVIAALFHPVGYHFYFYIIAGLAAAIKTITEAGMRNHFNYANSSAVRS